MNVLKFTVTKNYLKKTGAVKTTEGSKKYDYLLFSFDEDWEGLDVTVVVKRGGLSFKLTDINLISKDGLNDWLYQVPWEITEKAGAYSVGVRGTKADGTTIPTNTVTQSVDPSVTPEGEIPDPPTPDLYAQMLAEFAEATAACEEYAGDALDAKEAAEAAAASVPDLTQAVLDAQTAQAGAEAAQTAIENMTVSGEAVASTAPFEVAKSVVAGVANLHFKIPTGATGADGREIIFRTTDTHIQWQYDGDAEWTDLIALSDLKGADGEGLPTGGTNGQVLYKTTTGAEWNNLPTPPDISTKADKVTGATNGNFAGLDANGNLADSGKKAADFAEASHGHDLSSLTADSTHRLVTDTEKTTWNAKQAAITEGTDYVGISANDSGKAKPERISAPIRTEVTGNVTLALADAGRFIPVNSSSAITVTIPTNSSVAFPIGTEIEIYRRGSGTVTLGVSSLTIECMSEARTIKDRYTSVVIKKLDTDTWNIQGNVG